MTVATKPFPYYVGIYSLEELVTKSTRVCVVNILGTESRKVTPVSHEYSGGNVVAGVQYGRRGKLETRIGDIPVYRSIRDVMEHGHEFDIGVIYLPPMAVSQAVWELVLHNKQLKRIVIVTEKVPIRDSRNVRFICQEAGVDVIGANCLGVANIWDHVRVGGALGGDNPEETLKKGSIAIHSNSGNFTTTIAEYLRTSGFGISTVVSSGKDVYIHFALPEFLYAAQNDPRTKAVAVYVEPGGYYEKQALEWISERRFSFNKPIVVCVTGRWKKDIVRSCGHAGAMAGSGDDAESKEKWFDEYFNCGVFDPANPVVSKKGVRVTSIQHIPAAMHAVFKKMDEKCDFKSSGDLRLKLWISDTLLQPEEPLRIPVARAMPPYDKQILEINKQVGAHYLRQNMRNKSGASRMDPVTQVSALHGKSILELSKFSLEENIYFSIAKVMPDREELPLLCLLLNRFLEIPDSRMAWIDDARLNGCTPNAVIGSWIASIGNPPFIRRVQEYIRRMIDGIRESDMQEAVAIPKEMEQKIKKEWLQAPVKDAEIERRCARLIEYVRKNPKNVVLALAGLILDYAATQKKEIVDGEAFLIAVLTLSLLWKPMLEKRISRQTAEDAVLYFYSISQMVSCSALDWRKNAFRKKLMAGKGKGTASFSEHVFQILFQREPSEIELIELKYLLGLTVTNGPGTISAKGAKESVSARNHIPMAFTGFLTNTGLAHGGNGFEAVEFLLKQFENVPLEDPGSVVPPEKLTALANTAAKTYAQYKVAEQETGKSRVKRIPCIGHPVFKGNQVNIDPREEFIRNELHAKHIYNVFHEFYHHLVRELFNEGVTREIFCVNVDAVLAVITLKLIWQDYKAKRISLKMVQDLTFTLFILGRAIGAAAEIADHRDRGLDMDCRTPQSEVGFVL